MAQDRRTFLRLALVSVATARFAPACSSSGGASPQSFGDVSAGNKSALTVGAITALSNAPAFIARDDKGVYAMTTTCTHQACDLREGKIAPGSITCQCHGSHFDGNGEVLGGPATAPLVHYAVSIDAGGAITVHGGQQVAADVRVAV
jgi:Rieske Fe-S protein